MIQALIFDCFGVLYRDNLSMLYDAVPERHHQALKDIIHATDNGFLSREEYYANIADLATTSIDQVRGIERQQHSRDDAMIAYSQTFKPDYKVGLLSNIDGDTIDRLFPEPERSQLFDAVVASGEVGTVKPSIQIFEIAATRLGLEPESCVMIDDLSANIAGAELAGMQGIVFTSQQKLQLDIARLLGGQRA